MADDPPDELTGALARVIAQLPGGGEVRDGQVEMAVAVAESIASGKHLVVQAGTGTGKSLAYLVPAVLSGKRVVVATATKALQDQLANKDLPFLARHLGREFTFAVLKGRSNYLCVQRAAEVGGEDDQLSFDGAVEAGSFGREIIRLIQWGRRSSSGDRAELDFEPRPQAWSMVSVSGMECPGAAKCPRGDDCFAEKARFEAAEADVVVVNTHLYGAHLASGGNVLGEHDVVVFDEAHELEDVAAISLGLELGPGRFRAFARGVRRIVDDDDVVTRLDGVATAYEEVISEWAFKRLPSPLPEPLTAVLTTAFERVNAALGKLRSTNDDGAPDEHAAARARWLQAGGHLAGDITFVQRDDSDTVTWVEGPAHAPSLKVAAVDVGNRLAERLWSSVTGVLTSATIPPNLADRVGLPAGEVEQLDVGSPFHFDENALLYCATHLPDPRSPGYEAAMHAELELVIRAAGGRALALFTSWRAMEAAANALRDRLPWRVLTQSDLPKPALVKAFTDDETSCLFATMGFWQGVDVPGPALSLVALDRIPFPRPDEPLLQARRDRAGKAAFRVIDLPRAATLLAQGAGRLIRTSTDRGVVAVLDPRLAKANYRWDLVRALPPMKRTRHLAEVEAFLAPVRSPTTTTSGGGLVQ